MDGVLQNLKTTEDRVRGALGDRSFQRGLQLAAGVAQVNYMSGPRPSVLDVVTGRFRQSIVTEVEVDNNEITGRIGSNLPYAAYHEFGFHGVENVSAHSRVTELAVHKGKAGAGVFIVQRGTKKLSRSQKTGFAGVTFVKAHSRKVDYAGRPYLRPALEDTDIAGEINTELGKLSNG